MTDTARLNREQAMRIALAALRGGVRDAVVSPGARNTPLVLTLHDLHEMGWPITLHSVIDERSAAFFALGIARITARPVLLSCTSGSAGANYFPAIAEANQSQVPLLVVTADRPEELQDCGAPQTMNQHALFAAHVRAELQLGTPTATDDIESIDAALRTTIAASGAPDPGPVHINAMFRKPLWAPDASAPPYTPLALEEPPTPTPHETASVEECLSLLTGHRGAIVAGPDPNQTIDSLALTRLAELLGWPILSDPVSPTRNSQHTHVVRHYDGVLRSAAFRAHNSPAVLLSVGGTPSSKPLQQLYADTATVRIDPSNRRWDPWGTVTASFACPLATVAEAGRSQCIEPAAQSWLDAWLKADSAAAGAIRHIADAPIWEGSIVARLLPQLPTGTLLRLASSMPIRDADSFGPRIPSSVRVTSNRGVNGIDGLIATSMGEAAVHQGPTVVLSGDLSFLHDSGSLSTVPQPTHPLVLIVFDNGGGAIFSYLPMVQHPTGFTPWFTTPHRADIGAIAEGHGVPVFRPQSTAEVTAAVAHALTLVGVSVIHVRINPDVSRSAHEETWQAIDEAVQKTV